MTMQHDGIAVPTPGGVRGARPRRHAVPRPNEGVWPGLATPPVAPAKARIAESLFRNAVRSLPVRVVFPGGERLGAGGPTSPPRRCSAISCAAISTADSSRPSTRKSAPKRACRPISTGPWPPKPLRKDRN